MSYGTFEINILTIDGAIESIRNRFDELSKNSGDTAYQHQEADDGLCLLLTLLGFPDVVDNYAKIKKWYE
jgi:hypothetical protein